MSESVMVVRTKRLAPYIAGKKGLILENYEDILRIISEEHTFIPRPEAEEDPSYKQIIPHIVLVRGDEVFMTRRLNKGGEARLHGLCSLGVGGHINPSDEEGDALMNGLRRELEEEVYIEKQHTLRPHGVINDDENSVGSVHLGFFFTLEVEGEVRVLETEKLEGSWVRREELINYRDNMETWGQIVMEAL